MSRPTFRFAPSPNGRLHLGHASSALLNERLARACGGRLLLRLEDIDAERCRPDYAAGIAADLAWLGIAFDGPTRVQSAHLAEHRAALATLRERGLVYPCFCSRGEIARAAGPAPRRDPDGAPLYPGTCRALAPAEAQARIAAGEPHAWRLAMADCVDAVAQPLVVACFAPEDLGPRGEIAAQPAPAEPARWGDAVVARKAIGTSYHLAVTVDDAAQGVSHVVRGLDLLAATDLHVLLQRLLGLPSPAYHHHALVSGEDGLKLAKSARSPALAALREQGVGPGEVRRRLGFA